jgi:hypothetical protein
MRKNQAGRDEKRAMLCSLTVRTENNQRIRQNKNNVARFNSRISILDLLVLSLDHDQKDITRKMHMAKDIKRLLALIL